MAPKAVTATPQTPRADAAQSLPEWRRRWQELQQARAELERLRELAREIETAFQRDIAPRERTVTQQLAELTAALIEQYALNALGHLQQALLGKWIVENLATLKDHPFANASVVATLDARWRQRVAPLANTLDREAEDHRAQDTETPSAEPSTHGAQASSPQDTPHQRHEASLDVPDVTAEIDTRALVSPLFRKLAQTLHPDREPDPKKRKVKQELMRAALAARANGDVDALLDLHQRHVGETTDAMDGMDVKALLHAIGRQMENVQRNLRTIRYSRSLLRHVIDRYGSDAATRERRIEHHARRLDQAISELAETTLTIKTEEGLQRALGERHNAEMDTQTIRELTGVVD